MSRAAPRILIVDDDRDNRELLGIILSREQFSITLVASGEEALVSVVTQKPDVILLDVMMQGIDGYEVVAALRQDVATKDIPVIMLTGLDDSGARLRMREAGVHDYLVKPIDRTELVARIRDVLGRSA